LLPAGAQLRSPYQGIEIGLGGGVPALIVLHVAVVTVVLPARGAGGAAPGGRMPGPPPRPGPLAATSCQAKHLRCTPPPSQRYQVGRRWRPPVADAPGVVGHQNGAVDDVADQVVQAAVVAEGLVPAVVAHHEQRPEHGALGEPVQRPQPPAAGARRGVKGQGAGAARRRPRAGGCTRACMRAKQLAGQCAHAPPVCRAPAVHPCSRMCRGGPRLPPGAVVGAPTTGSWQRRPARAPPQCPHPLPGTPCS